MNDQLKSTHKKMYFILGIVFLNAGGMLIGYGIGIMYSKIDVGFYNGLGIALVISSFILLKSYVRLFILENKLDERQYRTEEMKSQRTSDNSKLENTDRIYNNLISSILNKLVSNRKMFKKIKSKIGK